MKELKGTKENSEGLTKRQREAIPFLATSPTYAEGLKRAKVSKTTLYKWLKNPEFTREIETQREGVVNEAFDTLKTNLTKAITTLVGLLDGKGNPELKRRVCNNIIDYVFKIRELKEYKEMQERLEVVERIVLEKKTYR